MIFFPQTKMILNGLLENDLIDHVAENIEIQKISTFAQTKNPLIYMSLSKSSHGKYNVQHYNLYRNIISMKLKINCVL